MVMGTPIIIKNNKVRANLSLSHSIKTLSRYELPFRYPKRNKKGELKSDAASKIIDLRLQFQPFCRFYHNHDDFDPEINEIIGKDSESSQDFIHMWEMAHRHGFPSELDGPGRGERNRVRDIFNHPLSYFLLCNSAHEEYDKENGDWRNNRKPKPYVITT